MENLKKYKTIYKSDNCNCKIIEADIFKVFSSVGKFIILHAANCFCTQNSGIARLIKEKYNLIKSIYR